MDTLPVGECIGNASAKLSYNLLVLHHYCQKLNGEFHTAVHFNDWHEKKKGEPARQPSMLTPLE